MRRPAFGYQNAVLSAIAVILAVGLIDRRSGGELTSLSQAQAQVQPDQGGMTNALEQRKIMIADLKAISARLERIEAKLNSGISVKVTSMPPVQVNNPPETRKPKNDDAKSDKNEVSKP